MTILCFDGKILAADTLTSAGGTRVYSRSKIRIIKQHAIATTGLSEDGDRFDQWFQQQNRDPFNVESYFGAFVLTKDEIKLYSGDDEDTIVTQSSVETQYAVGSGAATAYAEALMREIKYNAHKACERAARYDRNCDLPVYSISKRQLDHIHQDFTGFWIGTYITPVTQIEKHLITHKQWLKT